MTPLCAQQGAGERSAQAKLPQGRSPMWATLRSTRIHEDDARGLFTATHPPAVKALVGKTLSVPGFIMPLDAAGPMILLLLLAGADAPGAWAPVGVSSSQLRVFVERASVRRAGDRRTARVRIGSPGAISGRVVVVVQDEEVDCRARTRRLVSYDAHDAGGRSVRSGRSDAAAVPVVAGTIGDAVVGTVCAF